VKTLDLDRLAVDGVGYTLFYTTAPVCPKAFSPLSASEILRQPLGLPLFQEPTGLQD
jgi:hypothetical protein